VAGVLVLEPGEIVSPRALRERIERAVATAMRRRHPDVELEEHVCEKGRIEVVKRRKA
jgi:hypothetical protein